MGALVDGHRVGETPAGARGSPGATVLALTGQKDRARVFGTCGGLVQRRAGTGSAADFWRMFGATDGLPGQRIQALLVDSHDRLWVGTDSGMGVFNGSGWRTYSKEKLSLIHI